MNNKKNIISDNYLLVVKDQKPKKSRLKVVDLQTVIKGDTLIREIGAASIIAKVQRDQYMIDLSHKKKYRHYSFDRHK